jgi:methionyl aminopeptidase
MIYIKTPQEIEHIRNAGKISANIMKNAIGESRPGTNLLDLEEYISSEIEKNDAQPWFKEKNGYPFVSCLSVNDVWVHGMPHDYKLTEGDILSIDLGVKYKGFYTDHCWTIGIGQLTPKNKEFLDIGEKSLFDAIKNFKQNGKLGDISHAMQKTVEDAGFNVIRDFIGHGVGIKAHEDPVIPCYGRSDTGVLLRIGMVFAIEIMYSMGTSEIKILEDGWSVCAADNSLTGMFEHTVALTENGPEILTI